MEGLGSMIFDIRSGSEGEMQMKCSLLGPSINGQGFGFAKYLRNQSSLGPR